MIGWLIGANVIAELISPKGDRAVKAWAEARNEALLYLSVLTLAEYDKGLQNLEPADLRRIAIANARDSLEARFGERILAVSNPVVRRWGAISGAVKRAVGHSPSVVDTLLAATALEHDLYLVTRNVRDVQHSGAAVFNPWTDDVALFPVRYVGKQRRNKARE